MKNPNVLAPVLEAVAQIIIGLEPQPKGPLHGNARRPNGGLRFAFPLMCKTTAVPESHRLASAEQRAIEADRRCREAEMRGAILTEKIEALEAAEAKYRAANADGAVQQLIAQGTLEIGDIITAAEFKARFQADPELIPLAMMGKRRRPQSITTRGTMPLSAL